MWRYWNLLYTGGKVKWFCCCGKNLAVSQRRSTESPYDSAIPLVQMHPRWLKTGTQTSPCTCLTLTYLHDHSSQRWKQPTWPSADMWQGKQWCVHYGMLAAARRKAVPCAATRGGGTSYAVPAREPDAGGQASPRSTPKVPERRVQGGKGRLCLTRWVFSWMMKILWN